MNIQDIARPVALSIAGFDPSGGAGLLADIKTFEKLKVYGFGVATANTIQNDETVKKVDWISPERIIEQTNVIMEKFTIDWVKIGIVENDNTLRSIVTCIKKWNKQAKIIWDPVLMSSSGYPFIKGAGNIKNALEHIWMLTPNLPEFRELVRDEKEALEISKNTGIYLKGGHNENDAGIDYLFFEGEKHVVRGAPKKLPAKHGSGCVLSAALCAHLALGLPVREACAKSKNLIEKYLASNTGLLGWHP